MKGGESGFFIYFSIQAASGVYSQAAALYNVKQLPALFILDKNGNLVKRVENIGTLEASIKGLL